MVKLQDYLPEYYDDVYGQGTQGSISGKINNENGQAIHAGTVEVKNESTGFTTTTTTNEKGEFYFKQLHLGGPYTIIAYSVELGEQIKNGYQLNLGDDMFATCLKYGNTDFKYIGFY